VVVSSLSSVIKIPFNPSYFSQHVSNYTDLIGCPMWSRKVIFNRQRCVNEQLFPFGKVKRIAA